MTYTVTDAQTDIAVIQDPTSDPNAQIASMQQLVYQAGYDPAIRLVFASTTIFQDTLNNVSTPVSFTSDGVSTQLSMQPAQYMLTGITNAIEPGLFSLGDPAGIADWVSLIDVAGAALAQTIQANIDPLVTLAALQLVKTTALPTSWVHGLNGALTALTNNLPASAIDQATRAVLVAAIADAKANVLTVANQLAQNAVFTTVALANGQTAQVAQQPPRASVLPWYKRIELWGGLVGGIVGGVELYNRRHR